MNDTHPLLLTRAGVARGASSTATAMFLPPSKPLSASEPLQHRRQ